MSVIFSAPITSLDCHKSVFMKLFNTNNMLVNLLPLVNKDVIILHNILVFIIVIRDVDTKATLSLVQRNGMS